LLNRNHVTPTKSPNRTASASGTYVPPGLVVNSNENKSHNQNLMNSGSRGKGSNTSSYM
jgi:hypothetical protein